MHTTHIHARSTAVSGYLHLTTAHGLEQSTYAAEVLEIRAVVTARARFVPFLPRSGWGRNNGQGTQQQQLGGKHVDIRARHATSYHIIPHHTTPHHTLPSYDNTWNEDSGAPKQCTCTALETSWEVSHASLNV
jgi:hypothetical protein